MSELFCLWDGSVHVYSATASQAYICATVVCATDTNAVEHRLDVIDSWAAGPLAPFWFYFSLDVPSGNSNVCFSLWAKQLFVVLKMKITFYHYMDSFFFTVYCFSFFLFYFSVQAHFRQLAILNYTWKRSRCFHWRTVVLHFPNVAMCFHVQIWPTIVFSKNNMSWCINAKQPQFMARSQWSLSLFLNLLSAISYMVCSFLLL